ncbi:MAG: hypothetical protein JO307_22080 [Bryobacterales bacterium]|nr:hypothetical protein [Bryobacterales bacterium]MBV9397792.1 hypothetical protein [Bryobacterales bacterium]
MEEYRDRAAQGARSRALRIWYFKQVLSFVNCASLRRALLPGSLAWTVAAGIIEVALLIVAAQIPEWAIVASVGVVLAAVAVCVLRTHLTRSAVFLASTVSMVPFAAAALYTLRLPIFNPLPGVGAFFVCATAAALHASDRTGRISAGIAAATITGFLIAIFTAGATTFLHHPHPPFASFAVLPGIGATIGVVAGSFGRRFGRFSAAPPELLSITVST